jgi:hypothetical protein
MLKVIISRFFFLCLYCFIPLSLSANEIKNNPNILTRPEIIEWQLVDITYLSNNLIKPEALEQLLKNAKDISVKSWGYKLILDQNHTINIRPTTDNLSQRFYKLLQKGLERLNLADNQQENQYFAFVTQPKQYNLNQSLVVISDHLFLFTNNEIVLVFKSKQKMRQELASIYKKLNITNIPLNNRYWSNEEENDIFLPITDEFNYFFRGMIDDGNLKALKLKSYKKIKLLLLSSCAINSIDGLSLISLSDYFDIIDRLEIGEYSELEDGGILSEYVIDKNYRITISKIEHRNDKPSKLLSKISYIINDKGNFVKVEK